MDAGVGALGQSPPILGRECPMDNASVTNQHMKGRAVHADEGSRAFRAGPNE